MVDLKQFLAVASLLVFCSAPALAAPTSMQEEEASAFFESLMKQTQNPVIASMAQENLSKLQHKAQPTAMLAAATETESKKRVEVPFMQGIRHSLAVPVMLNSNVMGTFLVDTGATYTVITPTMAKKLGADITSTNERITILTANGRVTAPVVIIKQINVGSVQVQNVKALVQDFGNNDMLMAGVLGMNFFKNMDLTIKRDRMILSFSGV